MTVFFFDKENGKVVQRKAMGKKIIALKDGGWKMTLEPAKKRTIPQNAYLHGILIPGFKMALNSVGYRIKNDEEAKQVFKATFLTRKVENQITGEEMPMVRDTHNLSRKEMSELYDEVIQFCAEHMDYKIQYPNEQADFEF